MSDGVLRREKIAPAPRGGSEAGEGTQAERLLALAERCEREQPSWNLTLEIECAITPGAVVRGNTIGAPGAIDRDGFTYSPPPYTSSLDAAVALVPEGVYLAELRHVSPTRVWCVLGLEIDAGTEWSGQTKTEAMARCTAALRARAHEAAAASKAPAQSRAQLSQRI